MQNACPRAVSRQARSGLLVLSVFGSLAAVVLALFVGWSAGLCCYALAIAACLLAVLHAAAPEPAQMARATACAIR